MIIIDARRWFDKVSGNTYHSVSVNVDGKHIGRIPFAYGYGDQFKQSAFEILQGAGLFKKTGKRSANGFDDDYSDFLYYMMDHRDKFYVTVADVSRKRDL